MTKILRVTCKCCRYWHEGHEECRKVPPVNIKVEGDAHSLWPVTSGDDWCGEGKQKSIRIGEQND